MTRRRILTIRDNSIPGDYEAIEVVERDERELFNWLMFEREIEACFPVPMEFVIEKFIEAGREYKRSGKEEYQTYSDMGHK